MNKKVVIIIIVIVVAGASFLIGMNINKLFVDSELIGQDRAIEIALEHAGVSAEDASRVNARLTFDDGIRIYDVEFRVGSAEFWHEIVARTGEIHDFGSEGVGSVGNSNNQNPQGADESTPATDNENNQTGSNDSSQNEATESGPINRDRAIEIALAHAGVAAADASRVNARLTRDDGIQIFDVEFRAIGMEYWYEIVVATGAIHDFGSEIDD